MPYAITKKGDTFEVIEKGSGKVVGTHPSEEKAKAQLQALYANVPDAKEEKPVDSAPGGKSEGAEPEAPAIKIGAMISAANKAKLKAAHDAIRELMPECCAGEMETEAEKPEVESVDSAPSKSTSLPLFAYIKKLHLPYEDQYMADVLAVKSVARDTIRGYSMIWGDPASPDVEDEFFTKETDFWDTQLKGITRPLTYDHAQEPHTKASPIIGTIEAFGDDDLGRWFVAQLERNHKYRKAVDALISQRGVGASSDSASQYVVRKSAGKAVWLAQWPWFASALTPTPAEPRMLDVGLPYWKSAGVDFARMGAPEGAVVKLPEALRMQAQLLKLKAGVL